LNKHKGHPAKLALALMVAIYIPLSLAENGGGEATALNDGTASPADANAMSWPMLPGENVATLASLFYPDNPQLQKRFIAKTLQLSREMHPQLDAQSASNQAKLIMIPTLKSLAKTTGKIRSAKPKHPASWSAPLQMSYSLKDAALFVVSDALQAQYTALLERNASLKLQLEKLNAKLSQLQQTFTALSLEAKQFLAQATSATQAAQSSKTSVNSAPKAYPSPIPIDKTQSTPITEVTLLNQAPSKIPELSFSLLLWLPLLLLAGLLAWLAKQYTHRKSKELYLASVETFDPIAITLDDVKLPNRRTIDEVDFSLTQSGFTSMSVTDLSDMEQDKEDGELALEQARIYVHIGQSDEAIELLKAHIKNKPKSALHHWLYLLDIYRDTGQRDEFLKHAKQLHQDFNVMLPLWENEPVPMVIATTIEAFPHIVQQLTILWNDPSKEVETEAFLEDLLTDNRHSIRTGFSMEVFQEILLLKDLLLARSKLGNAVDEPNIPVLIS
jgi:tetratricopeptide (TPR) repeat protein